MKTYRPPFNYKESFGARVFYTFGLFILLVSSAFTLFFVAHQTRAVKAELMKKGQTLADLLSYSSKAGVFAENSALLADAVRGVMIQENVLEVSIHSSDGNVLFFEEKGQSHKASSRISVAIDQAALPKLVEPNLLEVTEREGGIIFLKPVIMEIRTSAEELYFETPKDRKDKVVIGYVRVVLDKRVLDKEVLSILKKSGGIAAVFLFFGAIVVFIAVKKATKPLENLTAKVRLLGMGEAIEKVPVESGDEIGKLAEAFNVMAEALRTREEEKHQVEEKLRHSQKMEAIGRLARGIAHDFNNVLTTVQGSVYILKKRLEDDGQLMHYAEQIHTSLGKLKNLIQGLLTLSKTQVLHFSPVDINSVIAKLTPVLENLVGEMIVVRTDLSPEASVVWGDPLQIERVLMNLCTNARDAMPGGGLFTIKTELLRLDGNGPGHSLAKAGPYVVISAADTGTGMDPETREKMFEPFFTTKTSGMGTGLGLSIVFGIIEQHGGQIDVRTEIGKGTEFIVYLPLLDNHDVTNTQGGCA